MCKRYERVWTMATWMEYAPVFTLTCKRGAIDSASVRHISIAHTIRFFVCFTSLSVSPVLDHIYDSEIRW